ncbi:MAG: FIST C-terminal domain-containing protein [Chitinivibrionales bacterium]|nr:FIST C-terminal domain-containing protein [Chitinivibrionales bacterium]
MRVGIATSNDASSYSTGQHLTHQALYTSKIETVNAVFAFCSQEVDHFQFFNGIRQVVGPVPPIIGGSSVGVISNASIFYDGCTAGVLLIESQKIRLHSASADHLNIDEVLTGSMISQRLPNNKNKKLMLLLYDSIKRAATATHPPVLNASPLLIKGIYQSLSQSVPIIGAGLLGDYGFHETYQFCGDRVSQQSAVATLMSGNFRYYSRIMHGCTPQDGIYHTITRSEGSTIYEVDNRPIIDWIDEMYGNQEWQQQIPVKRLTLGVNYGERYGEFDEKNFVNRLISGVVPDRSGIVVFEPDLKEGSEFMFMLRDTHEMICSARENTTSLMDQIKTDGARPLLAFYIDCAGRAARYSETMTEEASEVSSILNKHDIALFGFYSGVEVAPFMGVSRSLDWTGILVVFTE